MPLSDLKKTKDSTVSTFLIAGLLCIGCAFIVSCAAVALKSMQDTNVELDRKRNLLQVTGFTAKEAAKNTKQVFEEKFEVQIIDLNTGDEAKADCFAALTEAGKKWTEEEIIDKYDQAWASGSKLAAVSDKMESTDDTIRIRYREKFSHVFILKNDDGSVKNYVFPVRGYGLWSMMYGYLALKPDLDTVEGITFYDHGETPGLGGEIKSPKFVAQWPGKKVFAGDEVKLAVVKGGTKDQYTIDSLSGATITSNGVTNLIKFWMGPNGFGPFIEKQKSKSSSARVIDSIHSADKVSQQQKAEAANG